MWHSDEIIEKSISVNESMAYDLMVIFVSFANKYGSTNEFQIVLQRDEMEANLLPFLPTQNG